MSSSPVPNDRPTTLASRPARSWISLLFLLAFGPLRAQTPVDVAQSKPPVRDPARADTVFRRNSGVVLPAQLSPQQVESLVVLGYVWGFAKYYHPAVAQGHYNWDVELFRVLPDLLRAQTRDERSAVLQTWLANLGLVPPCAACSKAATRPVAQQPDEAWLSNPVWLSKPLMGQLHDLRENRHQGAGYYVVLGGAGNPVFKHEEAYDHLLAPDAGYRLLALYRYWNIIQYFNPNKSLLGEDWNKVLPEFIPRFAQTADAVEYRTAVLQLTARIHDTHAVTSDNSPTLTRMWGEYLVPVLVSFVEDKPVVTERSLTSLGAQTPLQKGDIILTVDHVPVAAIIDRQRPLLSASNEVSSLANIGELLLRGNTAQGEIEVLRDGKKVVLSVPRFLRATLESAPSLAIAALDSSYQVLAGNIGYLHLGKLTPAQVPRAMRALQNTKGLIVDLRHYPNSAVFRLLPAYFVEKRVAFAKATMVDLTYPGRFVEMPPFPAIQIKPVAGNARYRHPVRILVNEYTQSLAELTAMALRVNPQASVMGSTTAGADGDVSTIPLPGGLTARVSGTGILHPDGRQTQRVGIVPDRVVEPTVAGIRANRDEVLQQAVQSLEQAK